MRKKIRMAWERIVQRLGSTQPSCPKCRNVEIKFEDELAAVECSKCGWKGLCRELASIPINLNLDALRLIAENLKFNDSK
jgi:Zn ribbon nucleic-acid-binding protein